MIESRGLTRAKRVDGEERNETEGRGERDRGAKEYKITERRKCQKWERWSTHEKEKGLRLAKERQWMW